MKIRTHQVAFLQTIAPEYPENWKPINSTQAEALFNENAVMFGDHDGVPYTVAFKLFGWGPVMDVDDAAGQEAVVKAGTVYRNFWSCNGTNVTYLTRRGFRQAVTVLNARAYAAQERPFQEARSADLDEMDEAEKTKRGRK